MFDGFINGFCKVEFLCHASEPNWLGWIVLVFGCTGASIAATLALATTIGVGALLTEWMFHDNRR